MLGKSTLIGLNHILVPHGWGSSGSSYCRAESDAVSLQVLQGMEEDELEASDGVLGHMGALGGTARIIDFDFS